MASEVQEDLFVCMQNTGRFQMAAALLNVEAKGRIRIRSAGSLPAAELDPQVVEAMTQSAATGLASKIDRTVNTWTTLQITVRPGEY